MRAGLGLVLWLAAAAQADARPEPRTPSPAGYDARVLQSFRAAERFQGPLDGGWTFSTRNGWRYALQFADHKGKLEGAWRDLRRPGALGASGFVDVVERGPETVKLKFQPTGEMPIMLVLRPRPDGAWSGEAWRGDEEFPFRLERDGS